MKLTHLLQKLALCLLLLSGGGGAAPALYAQDDFNPTNPAEPGTIDFCKISVSADPAEGAYVSGGGKYKVTGGRVYITTSARNTDDYTYTFQYWTLDGEVYSYSRNFYFTPVKGEADLVAHYTKQEVVFDPANPAEPSASTIKRRFMLYLTQNIEGACTFNTSSGLKHEGGSSIFLRVYPSEYYRFEGWRVDGTIVSTSPSFYYTMPYAATTIEAVLTELPYDPDSPIEPPSSGQEGIDTTDPGRQLINLTIGNAANTKVDQTRVVINEAKSVDYETGCDVTKFISADAQYQLYSYDSKAVKYQINERPAADGIIPLGIIVKAEGTHQITTSRLDCEEAVLVDKLLKVEHPLALGAYTFTSAAGTFEKRFELKVPVQWIVGDADGNGTVEVRDVDITVQQILGKEPQGFVMKTANVNADEAIDVVDVTRIIRILRQNAE